jgi:hypothetical protein
MRLSIYGPNLPRSLQSKGTFVAHVWGCKDTQRGDYLRANGYNREFATKREVAEDIYPPEEFESWDTEFPDSYIDDIYFAPCTKGLPRN